MTSTELLERSVTSGHPERAWAAASETLDPSIGIVVCIPSFRRPQHLRLTLESLAAQRTARRFAVVIVDNDAAHAAKSGILALQLHKGPTGMTVQFKDMVLKTDN